MAWHDVPRAESARRRARRPLVLPLTPRPPWRDGRYAGHKVYRPTYQLQPRYSRRRKVDLSLVRLPRLTHPSTPLEGEGLSRRVYPFIGLAIVGLVSLHGIAAITTSLALSGAMAVGVALVLIPLAEIDTPARSGIVTAIPVVGGFVLALYPLWADGTVFGVVASVVITALGSALVVLPWDRIPRYLHAISPIGALAVPVPRALPVGLCVRPSVPFF